MTYRKTYANRKDAEVPIAPGAISMTRQSTKPLSTKTIQAMKPGQKDLADVGENRGLRVSCGYGGTKTFYYRYKSPLTGKLAQIKIGNFPTTSLAQARLRLHDFKKARSKGVCPASEAKMEKRYSKSGNESTLKKFTLADLIELYLTEYIEDKVAAEGKIVPGARKPKGQKEVRRTLYADAVRILGTMEAESVSRKHVFDLIQSIVARGAKVQAGNVLRELRSAYEVAIGLGKLPDDFPNPALLAKSSLAKARVKLTAQKGKRVLSDNELQRLLRWLPGSAFTPTQKNVLRFALWTGCRTGEICNASWNDIDLQSGTLHISETKSDVERYVFLSQQAVVFLKALKLQTGDYPFPSQKTGKPIKQKQLSEQAWHLRKTNRMINLPSWTAHDLRRSVRTGLARLGCPSEVAEAVLGHSKKGIEGTYDLHTYDRECKVWLQKWSDHLDSLLSS